LLTAGSGQNNRNKACKLGLSSTRTTTIISVVTACIRFDDWSLFGERKTKRTRNRVYIDGWGTRGSMVKSPCVVIRSTTCCTAHVRASASKTGRQAYPTAHPLVCPPPHGSIGLRSSGCGQILSYNCRGTSVVVCCSDVCSCMCGHNW
jgi:hypothetical protein